MTGTALSRVRLVAGLLGVILVLGACRADLVVDIAVNDDGSGTVRATLYLDEGVSAALPDLIDDLRVADLRGSGWEVFVGPPDPGVDLDVSDDTALVVRMAKSFPSAGQLADVLSELEARMFPDATLELSRVVEETTYRATVTVDRTLSLTDFSDAEVEVLLGEPLGLSEDELDELAGRPVDEAVTVTLMISLPDGSSELVPEEGEPALTLGADDVDVFEIETLVVDQAVVSQLERAENLRAARPWVWAVGVVWVLLLVTLAGFIWHVRRRRSRRLFG